MPSARLSTALAAVVGAGALVGVLALPGSAETSAVTALLTSFDVGTIGQPVPVSVPNLGDSEVTVSKVVRSGGDATVVASRPGNGRAADLPAYNGAFSGPRSVFTAVDTDLADGDLLSPGLQRFTFGADFKLDSLSVGDGYDNGNNLIQRGLAGSSDQYKLQVDHTAAGYRPTCSITQVTGGTSVSASIPSTVAVVSDQWYRVRCTRSGSELHIAVTPYAADGSAQTTITNVRSGIPAVDLTWSTASPVVPLSIGGKVNPYGAIVGQSDQFNGVVDNALLTVG